MSARFCLSVPWSTTSTCLHQLLINIYIPPVLMLDSTRTYWHVRVNRYADYHAAALTPLSFTENSTETECARSRSAKSVLVAARPKPFVHTRAGWSSRRGHCVGTEHKHPAVCVLNPCGRTAQGRENTARWQHNMTVCLPACLPAAGLNPAPVGNYSLERCHGGSKLSPAEWLL
jgi:hypothetical protein